MPVVLYASETWPLNVEICNQLAVYGGGFWEQFLMVVIEGEDIITN